MTPPNPVLDAFRHAAHHHGLVVYVGAGLSRCAEIPAWEAMLRHLFVEAVRDDADAGVAAAACAQLADLPQGQLQPLVLGRLLKDQLGSGLRGSIRELFLASLFPGRPAGGPLPSLADLGPRLATPLFDAVAELVRTARDKNVLRGVVTYNYDDLLEAKLEQVGIPCTPVLSPLRAAGPGVLPVYHVHGHIPLSRETAAQQQTNVDVVCAAKLPEPARHVFRSIAFERQTPDMVAAAYGRPIAWVDQVYTEALNQVTAMTQATAGDAQDLEANDNFVLAEDEYHREYAEPFRWSNIVQTSLLRCHAALFIGLSLADPNHRRLIDLTQKAGAAPGRFAVLSQPALHDAAKQPLNELTQVIRRMDRLSLARLAVHAVEAADHVEVPSIVRAFARALP